jgi:hypothetical protein
MVAGGLNVRRQSRHHGWHRGILVDLLGDTAFRMCLLTSQTQSP